MSLKNLSVYISYLLRHHPEDAKLDMDDAGWVSVSQLIDGINQYSEHEINYDRLKQIVKEDEKSRYRFNEDETKIKACQGHSIEWVVPELTYMTPPDVLYHGTTAEALEKILQSGVISKMKRHAVHMQASQEKAWQSATRWRKEPVLLKIDAKSMAMEGFAFGKSDNDIWCTESVPVKYILDKIKYLK